VPLALGDVAQTLEVPIELPIEVEIEVSPAGSLKQAPLWKELAQLLENPYAIVCPPDNPATLFNDESNYCTATIERRPGFGVAMPPLRVYSLAYNFLTGQPMRLRTSDGEVSWDQPGPMFDPDEVIETSTDPTSPNTPVALRRIIGHVVACPNVPAYAAVAVPANFCLDKPAGSLVVYNTTGDNAIPPSGTVVAVSALDAQGRLLDEDGEIITELETPINEIDFFKTIEEVELSVLPVGREAAEVLGKALFWDMQLGSDGVQACGSCHFHAGVDNRTRGQLNPGTNAGDLTLDVRGPNEEVQTSDFPFHQLVDPEVVDEETNCGFPDQPACGAGVIHDANDVMSSMGVSRFKVFNDIPPIGSFLPPVNGVQALPPDIGTIEADPVPDNEGFRRVEPRHTPTFHGAAFNFDNFWDSRARFHFNGGSVFGPSDPQAHIFIREGLTLVGATNGHIRHDLVAEEPDVAGQPVRIKFSSLASQSVGPPLSNFEMSFDGRNWAKIGKKLLQAGVTPLANQLVATTDSVLGPFSNQGGSVCVELARPTAAGRPGLCTDYQELIRLGFRNDLWNVFTSHLAGAEADCTGTDGNGFPTPAGCDPFDGYVLTIGGGAAAPANTDQFTQMEANFSLFFGLSVQAYEELTIPDDTPVDRFFDANPNAGHGVGEPGDQAVLFPTLIPDLIDDGILNGTAGTVTLIPDNPATPEYDGFGPDELFGFDLFAGSNLTAAIASGETVDPNSGLDRNPEVTNSLSQTIRVGSNPFTRSAKCMLCHLGPEQTDHSINISHGLLKNDAEFEYPTPPFVPDPTTVPVTTFDDGFLPAPEPSGSSRTVPGLILAEEVGEGPAQDAVEVEPRNFATFDDPATPWDDSIIAQPGNYAFGDQGVYNIGLRPFTEDLGRGGDDEFGWPLSLSALTLKNIGGQDFEPCDTQFDSCAMANFDPFNIGFTFEETGDGAFYPGTTHTLQSVNPGFERNPINPQMPAYMAPWMHSLPAGELHPQIDEMAGMVPNTLTAPNGGPAIEFPEILFGADLHCANYDPAVFGTGPPNFGWGPPDGSTRVCPNNQSGVTGNFEFPVHGTWPVPNRVIRDGAFKAPPLRNVEMTGPYFHTGGFLTLRQVVDFYMRGGDFPITNAEGRDPNINDLDVQTFSFGRTTGADLAEPVNHLFSLDPPFTLIGTFADGLPDGPFLYDEYPDSDHPLTPEPVFASRLEALEDAKNALVKFLIALTDPRVKYERAPFDHPEIFVPIDGAAPENTGGPAQLVSLSGVPCPDTTTGDDCFRRIPASGAAGIASPVTNFLEVTNIPPGADGFNCDPGAGPISHFCP
jgi:cytochrome c peroxidase